MNGRDLQSIYMESGNGEGNEDRYEFIFDQAKFTDNLIPAGAEFDVRISFQKPGGFGDFYELYLQDEFTITFPMMPEVVYPIPETDFEQTVFQSGVWLPEWERFYLIRCLYSSTNQKNQFLGWKVQLLKDIGNGKELSHPIWAMNEIEEVVLENVLMDNIIFSKEDLE